MSFQVSAVPVVSTQNVKSDVKRPAPPNYHPSIWGNQFLSCASNSMETCDKTKHLDLKEKVKRMVMDATNNPLQNLDLIDAIQRLGVSYHFEAEINQVMEQMYKAHRDCDSKEINNHLYTISLRFRLLRQHGYNIKCSIFERFKDSEGNFMKSLISDVKGMLSLYEATHLRVHGEDILDEALSFTTTHLELIATQLESSLGDQIRHALKQPIHRGILRLEARHYMPIYKDDLSHNEDLLTFAMLDFNVLQKMHQKELGDIAGWWKDLDFSTKLPFARDRVIECYFWTLGTYFEPDYAIARKILTKVIAMTSIMDDIYDAYGTIEELELFTQAVERWDINAMNQLPEYMKCYYEALIEVYEEIEENMLDEEKAYRVYYAKEAMKKQARYYFLEAKWFHQQYVATMEEYMSVALVTSAYSMLAITSLVGMGDIVTKDTFHWLASEPKIVKASEIICRLMDDIVSHKFEQKRGHVASSIECYMKQYGSTEKEAIIEFKKQVIDAWKDINEECLQPSAVPMPILTRVLNLSRVIDVIYKDEDGYTHANIVLKDLVASLLINPVSL